MRSLIAPTTPIATVGPVPRHYDYDLTFDPKLATLTGTGSVSVENNSSKPLDELQLRLWANAAPIAETGGYEQVTKVTVDGAPVDAVQRGTVLTVPLMTYVPTSKP